MSERNRITIQLVNGECLHLETTVSVSNFVSALYQLNKSEDRFMFLKQFGVRGEGENLILNIKHIIGIEV